MARTAPADLERDGWGRGLRHIVGVDEAGRGPLAGPVVAAAVALPPFLRAPPDELVGATDSKLLPSPERERLAGAIRALALGHAVAAASPREIERLNIRGATALAMRRAVHRLPFRPELLLVDGLPVPELGEHRSVVRGDRRSLSIACASILAKVVRDRLMVRLAPRYPDYGWADNKGYATAPHLAAIREHGPTRHHRATWAPIAQHRLRLEA
ncbi:MAG: ribonuclease HII [Gemmatimonadota bacterium]|nr:ribonuclease HII [Gemmatimonadota bacterium]